MVDIKRLVKELRESRTFQPHHSLVDLAPGETIKDLSEYAAQRGAIATTHGPKKGQSSLHSDAADAYGTAEYAHRKVSHMLSDLAGYTGDSEMKELADRYRKKAERHSQEKDWHLAEFHAHPDHKVDLDRMIEPE